MTHRTEIPDARQVYREDVLKTFALGRDLMGPEGELPKTLMFMGNEDGRDCVTMAHVGELRKPSEVSIAVLRLWLETKATRVYFIGDAWFTTLMPGDTYVQPSKSDKRRETLIVSAFDKYLGYCAGRQPYERDNEGKRFYNEEPSIEFQTGMPTKVKEWQDNNLGILQPFLESQLPPHKVN